MEITKKLLFCTMYMDSLDAVDRYYRWFKYYLPRLHKFGNNVHVCAIDDGSEMKYIEALEEKLGQSITVNTVTELKPAPIKDGAITVYHFEDNLGRPILLMPAGWWRSFSYASQIAMYGVYTHLIHVESDSYIFTDKLFRHIGETVEGWHTLSWAEKDLPEANIQWLSQNHYHKLELFWRRGKYFWFKNGLNEFAYAPEFCLPFTHVWKEFIGGRTGEDSCLEVPENSDYSCNTHALDPNKTYNKNELAKLQQVEKLLAKNDPNEKLYKDLELINFNELWGWKQGLDEFPNLTIKNPTQDNPLTHDNIETNVTLDIAAPMLCQTEILHDDFQWFVKEFLLTMDNNVAMPNGSIVLYPFAVERLKRIAGSEWFELDEAYRGKLLNRGSKKVLRRLTELENGEL